MEAVFFVGVVGMGRSDGYKTASLGEVLCSLFPLVAVAMGVKPHRYRRPHTLRFPYRQVLHLSLKTGRSEAPECRLFCILTQTATTMGQTYHSVWVHLVWATKHRTPLITPGLKHERYSILRGIAEAKGYHLNFINGVEDHIHLLMRIPPQFAISTLVRELKGVSHMIIRKRNLSGAYFHWQDGYAAFSVSPKDLDAVRDYIRFQERHHANISFETEWERYEKMGAIVD